MKHLKVAQLLSLVAGFTVSPLGHAADPYSGWYLFVQDTTSVTNIPVIADVVATTRGISVQELRFDGTWLHGSGKVCDVTISSNSKLVKTTLPRAFIKALPPVVIRGKVEKAGGTRTFHQSESTLVLGAKLDDEREPLPTDPHDPRVRDDDRDGQPGVTVRVSGIVTGDIYLVQRSKSSLSGHDVQDGFAGRVTFTNEQRILGATRSVLKRDPGALPDEARSRFVLRKLPQATSCDEAVRAAQSIARPK